MQAIMPYELDNLYNKYFFFATDKKATKTLKEAIPLCPVAARPARFT
jgi:hypothetical protein